jgi:hypothetical protein
MTKTRVVGCTVKADLVADDGGVQIQLVKDAVEVSPEVDSCILAQPPYVGRAKDFPSVISISK